MFILNDSMIKNVIRMKNETNDRVSIANIYDNVKFQRSTFPIL